MKFARTALAGGAVSALAVAGLVTAQAALAAPSPRVSVPCSASTLVSDINDNTASGQTFLLAHRCTYVLTTGDALTIPTDSRITGNLAGADGGGGIYDAGTDVAVTLTDSQVTHNHPDNCAPAASVAGCTG